MLTDNEVQVDLFYTYKDNTYVVKQCDNLLVKSPHDGNWYPAVAYTSSSFDDNHPEMDYVCELEDFKEKFKAVDEDCGE